MPYRWEGGNQVMEGEDLTLRDDLIVGDDLAVGWDVTITGSLSVAGSPVTTGWVILGAGDNLVGSSTSDITINTDKFKVAWATGNTVVWGTLTSTGLVTASTGATVTAGDVTLTDGDLILTANASKLSFTGTGANGWVLKNLKNAAASALSGTKLVVEIDIGWAPYYFEVYPTKA